MNNKLIISRMDIAGTACDYAALLENGRLVEFQFAPVEKKSILGEIYVGKVDRIASNIGGAFVKISPDTTCYFDLKEADHLIYASSKTARSPVVGDEILVQVSREAMKGKPPKVTAHLEFPGKYIVLTTGRRGLGVSSKLSGEDRARLRKLLEDAHSSQYSLVARTNAGDASDEEILRELEKLRGGLDRTLRIGRTRVCYSVLRKREPFYLSFLRNVYTADLSRIVTDVAEMGEQICGFLVENQPKDVDKYQFYSDKLLPLGKLCSIESKFRDICQEKVWLRSGGFLMIQQTEAFVAIDVNSGKFTGKKNDQETYRKINLEAAAEIAIQLRARNLSGIILIDFINMSGQEAKEELMEELRRHVARDPVRTTVHDMTALDIVEVTRRKIRKPLWEEIEELTQCPSGT